MSVHPSSANPEQGSQMAGENHSVSNPVLGNPANYGDKGIEMRFSNLLGHFGEALRTFRVLDLGCGNGAASQYLSAYVNEVHCIDVDDKKLAVFRERLVSQNIASIQNMDAADLDFGCNEFDLITIMDVLDHIPCATREKMAGELDRVLKPGAHIYAAVPNAGFPFEQHEIRIGRRCFSPKLFPGLPYIRSLHSRIATADIFDTHDIEGLFRDYRPVLEAYHMPSFERSTVARIVIKPICDLLVRMDLDRFGQELVMLMQKPVT